MGKASATDSFLDLQKRIREFVEARDWRRFHSPKNLTMALTGEVGELSEQLQWLTAEESDALESEKLQSVAEEVADVQIYLLLLADRLGIDLLDAVRGKLEKNEEKYPLIGSPGHEGH